MFRGEGGEACRGRPAAKGGRAGHEQTLGSERTRLNPARGQQLWTFQNLEFPML